jgi:hypothetical protein
MGQATSHCRRDLLDGVMLAVQTAALRRVPLCIECEAAWLQVEHPLAQLTLSEVRGEIRIAARRTGVPIAEDVAIVGARPGQRMATAWPHP